jgi:hypothetical protein
MGNDYSVVVQALQSIPDVPHYLPRFMETVDKHQIEPILGELREVLVARQWKQPALRVQAAEIRHARIHSGHLIAVRD